MITSLTEEQQALFPVYRDKWIKIGLCTESADRKMAEEGVKEAYENVGLTPPSKIIWVDSPHAGQIEAKKINESQFQPCYGQHDASWLSYYDYFFEVFNLECIKKLSGLFKIAKSAGWWWAYEGLAIISERPCELHQDETGRLHCETGKALRYCDDWGFYCWHGVTVPEKVIMHPEQITLEEINSQTNIEVKRIMIERFGIGKYLEQSKATIVDMDASPIPGGAPRVLMKDSNGFQYLCGTDGSTERVYFMSVPNNVTTCRQAHEAISGISEECLVAEC